MRKNYQKPSSKIIKIMSGPIADDFGIGGMASGNSGGFAKPGITTTGTTTGTQLTIHDVWED